MERGIYRCSTAGCYSVGDVGDFAYFVRTEEYGDDIPREAHAHLLCRRCVKVGFRTLVLNDPGKGMLEIGPADFQIFMDEIVVDEIMKR